MPILVDLLLLGPLALLLTLPVAWCWRFLGRYRFPAEPPPAGLDALRAAVILPLRGADPFLGACLAALLDQDYPNYLVRIVVDSEDDPAWGPVRAALAAAPARTDVEAETLERPLETCTLKVSAQLQAVARLPADVDAVVLVDADAAPARTWLRALTAPLADPQVGAVNGNRWFVPARPGWGSLVRRYWNGGSISQMLAFNMPWGGSLAVRAALFRETDLPARWARSFCDDSGVGAALRALGLRLAFAPAATTINRESIAMGDCVRWVRRQLLCPRLDLAWWPAILAANVGFLLALAASAGLLAAGCVAGQWRWTAEGAALLAWYAGGTLSALVVGERRLLATVRAAGGTAPAASYSWRDLPAFVLAHLVHAACLAPAVFVRRVYWRGVAYAVEGPGRLRLVEYRPFRGPREARAPQTSIT